MALRVLRGEIKLNGNNGTVMIHFNPHQVSGNGVGIGLSESGARGNFIALPKKLVRLMEFYLPNQSTPADLPEQMGVNIESRRHDLHGIELSWSCSDVGEIRKLSYLVVGEALDS